MGVFPNENATARILLDTHQQGKCSRLAEATVAEVKRQLTDVVLRSLGKKLDRLYSTSGRPSIVPEYVARALLLRTFYSVHRERQLIGQLD